MAKVARGTGGGTSTLRRAAAAVFGMAAALSFTGASCGQHALSILPGVVNDPKNLTLRREILAYGTSRMCSEMLRRSMPLKLRDEDPIIGRFYATSCFTQDLANDHLFIQFGGYGYAWTNLTKRMTFEAGGAVEYDQDFLMDGGTMYVYLRQKSTSAATFTVGVIEQPMTSALGGLQGSGGQSVANTFGTQIMKNEIARGFTVIREGDGAISFGLGVVEKGQRPKTPYPYKIEPSGKIVLANERTEIHGNQRDFAGPFSVDDDDRGIYLTASVEGAPAVDVLLFQRGVGQAWLQQYTHQIATAPPSGPPMMDETVQAGPIWRRALRVPKGEYYVVFDNTATAGHSTPAVVAGDDRAGLVSFAVEIGDPP